VKKHGVRFAGFAILLSCNILECQELKRRAETVPSCPPTHVRFTARSSDGLPVSGLSATELRVYFDAGAATILSLQSGASDKVVTPDTNVLFVVRPYSDLNEDTVKALIKRIEKADNFRMNAAVLAPDGSISPFTRDPEELRASLRSATSSHRQRNRTEWPFAERDGFLAIRRLPGRHVIFDLTSPANPYRSEVKKSFLDDLTLDILAAYDMAQIYRLVQPVPLDNSIPMGDASAKHSDIGPENHSAQQMQEVQVASLHQYFLWLRKQPLGASSGGRNDESVEALFDDLLKDAPGTYDLLVRPGFACRLGAFYRVTIAFHRAGVRLFAPSLIQMVPATPQIP